MPDLLLIAFELPTPATGTPSTKVLYTQLIALCSSPISKQHLDKAWQSWCYPPNDTWREAALTLVLLPRQAGHKAKEQGGVTSWLQSLFWTLGAQDQMCRLIIQWDTLGKLPTQPAHTAKAQTVGPHDWAMHVETNSRPAYNWLSFAPGRRNFDTSFLVTTISLKTLRSLIILLMYR